MNIDDLIAEAELTREAARADRDLAEERVRQADRELNRLLRQKAGKTP